MKYLVIFFLLLFVNCKQPQPCEDICIKEERVMVPFFYDSTNLMFIPQLRCVRNVTVCKENPKCLTVCIEEHEASAPPHTVCDKWRVVCYRGQDE